jgi:hypothetical protein
MALVHCVETHRLCRDGVLAVPKASQAARPAPSPWTRPSRSSPQPAPCPSWNCGPASKTSAAPPSSCTPTSCSACSPGSAPKKPAPCTGPTSTSTETGRHPTRPAADRRLAISPRTRRHQNRTLPPRPRPPRSHSPGTTRLAGLPGRGAAHRRGTLARHRARVHQPPRRRPRRGQRQEMFKRVCAEAGIGDGSTPGTADLLRQPDEPLGSQHRGDRPPRRARHHPHHPNRLPPRTPAVITTGAETMDQLFTST